MLNINWTVKKMKVADLKDWSKNPRKITEDEYDRLIDSIKSYGFHDVLKIDTDNTIISGHQRRRALTEIGIAEVDVMVPDRKLTEREMEVVALSSNTHRGMFDFDILANSFDSVSLEVSGVDAVRPINLDEPIEETDNVQQEEEENEEAKCPTCGK